MFCDLLDMTLSYIQYITLLLRLDPDDVPDFYTEPFKVLRYIVLDTYNDIGENQRYNNYLRINLPGWLPLDIRLQYVCIAVIGPMVVATLGMLFVYGKPAYIWFVCALGTLFMFFFGFILLANLSSFAVPGVTLPSKSTLSVLGGVGLPCFILILAGGLLGMGRARLQLLRQDAREMERLIEEERQRRRDQRVTQQMVDREGIDLVAVAAEQVHAQRDKDAVEHIDWGDVTLQGLFVVVLLVGSLILLNAIHIPAIADMQGSTVFKVIGAVAMVLWGFVTLWWILDFSKKGRQLQNRISGFAGRWCLSLVVTVCNILYINVVTNFISIMYCVTLKCEAGTRTPYSASLFSPILGFNGSSGYVFSGSSVGCLSCDYHAYPQRCSPDWQSQLCTTSVQQRRLVYDPRVRCDDIDAFFKVSGGLIFATYLIFLPYLQFYMAQYAVQVLKDSYVLERRYYDVFTPAEIYFQKVLSSKNNAAFAYRAYKPEFRFYRLSFLLQKVILGVVSCVMREGLSHDVAWAGMTFFIVVPLIALSCSLYLQPFSRQVEAYYFVAVQAMVSVCAIVCLTAQQIRSTGMPIAVWIVLLVLLIAVPVCTLVVGNVITLQEERRWTELWQQRLVEGVTAAYEDPATQWQQQNPLHRPQQQQQSNPNECVIGVVDSHDPDSCSSSGSKNSSSSSNASPSSSTTSGSSSSSSGPGDCVETMVPAHRRARGQREEEEAMLGSETDAKADELRSLSASYAAARPQSGSSNANLLGIRLKQNHSHSGDKECDASAPSVVLQQQEHHQQQHQPSTRRSSTTNDDNTATLRGANATATAIAHLQKLRALPGLLQAETWGQSVRLVLDLAGRTIAAPFTQFYQQRGVVEDATRADSLACVRSAAREDSFSVLPFAASPRAPERQEQQQGKKTRRDRYRDRRKEKGKAGVSGDEQGKEDTTIAEMTEFSSKVTSGALNTSVSAKELCKKLYEGEAENTPLLAGTDALPPSARTVNALSPRHRHRHRHRSTPGVFSISCSDQEQQLQTQRSTSGASCSLSSVLAMPSLPARSSYLPSTSLSLSPHQDKLPIANPADVGRLIHQRASTSLSPGTSLKMLSACLQLPETNMNNTSNSPVFGALTTPSARVVVPRTRDLSPSQDQQQQWRNSLYHYTSDADGANHSLSSGGAYYLNLYPSSHSSSRQDAGVSAAVHAAAAAAALALEDAGEYGEDATETFIPSLYFIDGRRTRRHATAQRHRRGTSGLYSTADHLPQSAERNRLGWWRRNSVIAVSQEVDEVRFPWRRYQDKQQPQQLPVAGTFDNQQDIDGSPTDAEAQYGAAWLGPLLSSSSSTNNNNNSNRNVLTSVVVSLPCAPAGETESKTCFSFSTVRAALKLAWDWICNVDDDAARRRKNVLNFTDVYVRRQLCKRQRAAEKEMKELDLNSSSNNTHNNGNVLSLTPAQLRRCARKAFWGSPTDAMLGVMEVPGSMPPWGLYCHAPPPPPSRISSAEIGLGCEGLQQEQHRSMFSLQRQYYAQLAEEAAQRPASVLAQNAPPGSLLRLGSSSSINNSNHIYTNENAAVGRNSLTTSPVHTSLSLHTGFHFPRPMHPLRAAAYERQTTAVQAYQRETSEMDLLPLDTKLDAFASVLDQSDDGERNGADREMHSGVEAADISFSCISSAGQHRASGTLHWLQQWGPVLTELLYEAAMDDSRRAVVSRESENSLGNEYSDNDAASSSGSDDEGRRGRSKKPSDLSSSPSSLSTASSRRSSASSTSTSPRRPRSETGERNRRNRKKTMRNSSRLCWFLCMPWSWHRKEKKHTARVTKHPSSADEAANTGTSLPLKRTSPDCTIGSSHLTRSHSKRGVEGGLSGGLTAPSLSGDPPNPLRRQQSTLLTLITSTHTAQPRLTNDASSRISSVRYSSKGDEDSDELNATASANPTFLAPTNKTSTNSGRQCAEGITKSSSSTGDTRWRGCEQNCEGDARSFSNCQVADGNLDPSAAVATAAPTDATTAPVWRNYDVNGSDELLSRCDTTLEAPKDPLIQQLRCLHLVRQRLKESYWKHRDQLRAVQDYVDYEINETMRRVLTFLFIVIGTVATVSFTLALLGMLHTVDWHFINGVQRTNDNLWYELAGYASWADFTKNCCCMAATNLKAKYPYYALDVENWVCANGVTKERVRRDGYDDNVVDGYAVRALCGMEFKNNCKLTVSTVNQMVTVTGCDTAAVTPASTLRW